MWTKDNKTAGRTINLGYKMCSLDKDIFDHVFGHNSAKKKFTEQIFFSLRCVSGYLKTKNLDFI